MCGQAGLGGDREWVLGVPRDQAQPPRSPSSATSLPLSFLAVNPDSMPGSHGTTSTVGLLHHSFGVWDACPLAADSVSPSHSCLLRDPTDHRIEKPPCPSSIIAHSLPAENFPLTLSSTPAPHTLCIHLSSEF